MSRAQIKALVLRLRATADLHGMPIEAIETMRQVAEELEAAVAKDKRDGHDNR